MLFHWLDGIKHFAPDRYKAMQAPTLKSFYERAVLCPGIAKRLHERREKFTNKAPGSTIPAYKARAQQPYATAHIGSSSSYTHAFPAAGCCCRI